MSDKDAPVHVLAYDSRWPELFEEERAALAGVLAPWLAGPIEHVGSTSVTGLDAKPVIDIMAGVRDLETSRPAIAALSEFGYCYWPYREEHIHWFCRPSSAIRTHHLHLVPLGSQRWLDTLEFREILRANPSVAVEYANLKHRLAEQYEFDREAYTDAKGPFIERVLGIAREKDGRSV
jgi:GrpB-like predicted nucleotidyltransferase (UPF0157 family)